jgi:hypothetical protein
MGASGQDGVALCGPRAIDKVALGELRAGRPENPPARTPTLHGAAVPGGRFEAHLAA